MNPYCTGHSVMFLFATESGLLPIPAVEHEDREPPLCHFIDFCHHFLPFSHNFIHLSFPCQRKCSFLCIIKPKQENHEDEEPIPQNHALCRVLLRLYRCQRPKPTGCFHSRRPLRCRLGEPFGLGMSRMVPRRQVRHLGALGTAMPG